MSRSLAGVLWAALLCGPVALFVAAQAGGAGGVTPSASVAGATSDVGRDAAAEFAEQVVVTWLTATRENAAGERLEELVGIDAGQGLPATSPAVRNPAAAEVSAAGTGVWSVTVAVDVDEPSTAEEAGGAAEPASGDRVQPVRRYFQVPVSVSDDGVVAALAAPAPVPAPAVGAVPGHGYGASVRSESPVGIAVAEFLSALLAGTGGLERVVAPGVELSAVTPAPYSQVEVTAIAAVGEPAEDPVDGERAQVLVTANVAHAMGEAVVQYPLTLVARADRWEVEAIDPAPIGDGAVMDSGLDRPVTPSPREASGGDSSSTATP
ncbi:conjugal transfer protein [Jiangella rhizosphaerae]|uniref:conjugal transfer protein n=1 Tax=Jiangella rhizosphaerae TaxID=2293569 RepID=UPI0013148F95|nr:conjugal transfer protein [Jiangella rhizosphaerae]